jgi:alginate O-acetyltransferase complex protein AlgI
MVFSSTTFLFLFLPILLFTHYLLRQKFRNIFILLSSLFFYAWGEHLLVILMICSICINYIFGNIISKKLDHEQPKTAKVYLIIGVGINLLVLIYYKYIHFIFDNLEHLGIKISFDVSGVVLPIGISFFTFQSVSYLIDVYRKTVKGQKSIINLGMYISLFPQLIAGPIVRYADISKEIEDRKITNDLIKTGISRFIIGLSKKILIANTAGQIADSIFNSPNNEISTLLSWIGIICYTLQIYYDFSGYSDMAIGLGKILGFNFQENFNHPYISKSIGDFWRRWHISLSTWFRDYLYIPLGGNRLSKHRTYINLFIVFFATGLWHGASWNFIVWGLFHGFFLVLEKKLTFFRFPKKLNFLKHIYLLLVVMVGWVLFRSENLDTAITYLDKMFSLSTTANNKLYLQFNNYVITLLCIGIVFTLPIRKHLESLLGVLAQSITVKTFILNVLYLCIFLLTLMELAQTTYNPFIYYRF